MNRVTQTGGLNPGLSAGVGTAAVGSRCKRSVSRKAKAKTPQKVNTNRVFVGWLVGGGEWRGCERVSELYEDGKSCARYTLNVRCTLYGVRCVLCVCDVNAFT